MAEPDDDFDDDSEPIGSCDDCSVNVYPDDAHVVDGHYLCDQCAFYRQPGVRYG